MTSPFAVMPLVVKNAVYKYGEGSGAETSAVTTKRALKILLPITWKDCRNVLCAVGPIEWVFTFEGYPNEGGLGSFHFEPDVNIHGLVSSFKRDIQGKI